MALNPYSPPSSVPGPSDELDKARNIARFRFRAGLAVLVLAAFFNLYHFSQMVRSNAPPTLLLDIALLGNAIGLFAAVVGIWSFGFWILESLAWVIHRLLRNDIRLSHWNSILYDSFQWVPILSFVGGLLWVVWVIGYYMTQLAFFLLSIPVGVAAHALAATWYIPLFYQWSRLRPVDPVVQDD